MADQNLGMARVSREMAIVSTSAVRRSCLGFLEGFCLV